MRARARTVHHTGRIRELAGRLAKTQKKYAEWQDRLKNTDTSADGSFSKLHSSLARGVNALVKLVNHAEQSVKAVERQRDKYAQINDGELHKRKMYVTQTRRKIRSMKETMNSATTKAKIDSDKRAKLMGRREESGGIGVGGGAKNQSNNEFYKSSQADQRQLRRQQDETMDAMGSSVETLNEYAVEIGRELDSQKVLLDEFGNEIETVQTRMDKVLGGMQKLLKTKSESGLILRCCGLFFRNLFPLTSFRAILVLTLPPLTFPLPPQQTTALSASSCF